MGYKPYKWGLWVPVVCRVFQTIVKNLGSPSPLGEGILHDADAPRETAQAMDDMKDQRSRKCPQVLQAVNSCFWFA